MDQLDRHLRHELDEREASHRGKRTSEFGMLSKGPGWRAHQRSLEELVKSETGMNRPPPSGSQPEPPPRPRTWVGAAGLLGAIAVLVLWVLVSDCASGAEPDSASPSPSAAAVSALILAGHTSESDTGTRAAPTS